MALKNIQAKPAKAKVKPILDSDDLIPLGWTGDEKWKIENNFISYNSNGVAENISLNLITGEFNPNKIAPL